jgi:hypothetical protein
VFSINSFLEIHEGCGAQETLKGLAHLMLLEFHLSLASNKESLFFSKMSLTLSAKLGNITKVYVGYNYRRDKDPLL